MKKIRWNDQTGKKLILETIEYRKRYLWHLVTKSLHINLNRNLFIDSEIKQ